MATLAPGAASDRGETRFFFIMACAMAATIMAGFALNLGMGRSSFSLPLLYHVHAFVFIGWIALYLAQTGLIATGNRALHRRLGWLAVIWVPLMVAMGIAITVYSLRRLGGPPFFDQNEFLISNPLMLLGFAGLVFWAIAVRADTGWHRRLMFCAMAMLVGPGVGRLLPMPFMIPFAWWVSIGVPLLFPLIGVLADKRRYGRVHPAWLYGIAVVPAIQIVADLIAYSPAGYAITDWVLTGSPGAERPVAAFFPM